MMLLYLNEKLASFQLTLHLQSGMSDVPLKLNFSIVSEEIEVHESLLVEKPQMKIINFQTGKQVYLMQYMISCFLNINSRLKQLDRKKRMI